MEIKEQGALTMKGIYRFTVAKLVTPEHFEIDEKIRELRQWGKPYIELVRKLNSICETKVYVHENLIPTVGRQMLANNVTATSPDNNPKINYSALGSGSIAPSNADTQLGGEVYRKQVASATNASNVAYITAFYAATDTNGTYKEHGLFANASGTINSGVLFSRVLLNGGTGISKANTETLTIDYTITFS